MKSQVISARVPRALRAELERASARAHLSVGGGLDLLLRCSVANRELFLQMSDCHDSWDAKVDARISLSTFTELKTVCEQLGIPVSVYVRKLLYHLYGTRTVKFVGSNGHYTLAYRHE